MSIQEIVVTDVDGERRFGRERLPLKVGTSTDCALRIPGPGFAAVFSVDLLEDELFVQPLGNPALRLNGQPAASSARLNSGDELEFHGSRIQFTREATEWQLAVHLEDSAYVTKPPQVANAAQADAEEVIAPAAFRRAADLAATAPAPTHHRVRNLSILGLGALLLASYLLFSAKSVQFDVTPVAAQEVDIDGGWFRFPLGDRVLLRKGEYTVNVERDGYYPVSQAFVVGDEPSATVAIELRRLPGRLSVVTTDDVEATVSIDNQGRSDAPLGPIELQPGEHSVTVESDRYLPFADVVDIVGMGRMQVLHVQLVPRWAEVQVASVPAGAKIYSGSELLGETPSTVQLLEGSHQLSVLLDGYKAWDGQVIARPNEPQSLPAIELEPANARLRVSSVPRGANVTVNGRYRGQSPITLDLSPDIDYSIGLSKAGYGSASRSIRLAAAASEAVTIDLSARTGAVTVNVSPSDATVMVDGRRRATGSVTLELSSAPKRIEVKKDGFESWVRTITPRPGYPQTVQASLRSLEEVAESKIARNVNNSLGMSMRRVEPGEFRMGSSRSEPGRRANEVIVPVKLTRPYFISVHEVSNDLFGQFRANHDSGSNVSPAMNGKDNPAANVSWSDAVQFCNWLSAREGLPPVYEERFGEWRAIRPFPNGYRLPTEAEWEWAIRYAGQAATSRFPWGDQWPPKRDSGNFAGQSALGLAPTLVPGYDDGYSVTSPVGQFGPNALGIHDGSGNVAEWVNDYYWVPTPGMTTAIPDPLGPQNGQSRVIRGSSWRHGTESELRLSYRDNGTSPRADVGFRLVRNAD